MAKKDIEARVNKLLSQMTLAEKVSLLSGQDVWNTVPIRRLGIPSITMTDGPHGVRSANAEVGRVVGPATCFPSGVSMAASWNADLVEKVGQALGEETRGMDCDILLGPCVNIVRYPLGGRNFESYSEDPYLAGRTAVAFIKGVQSRGVGTSLKHYALNNYEIERNRASTNVDERTLREIYLPQFEAAVKEAQPWTVMCSYNRINGTYASQHDTMLNKILKEEWGFEGLVVSDWGANHTIFESVQGGLDLEMPGPARYYKLLAESVNIWQIGEEAIDKAVRRILRIIIKSGRMDGTTSKGSVNTPAHQALACRLAEEAITLLKNEGDVLPLGKKFKTIAVIGPNAAEAVIEGGGSSRVEPPYRVSPLEALKAAVSDKIRIEYEQGCDNIDTPRTVPVGWLKDPNGKPGLRRTTYATSDGTGTATDTRDLQELEMWWDIGGSALGKTPYSARLEGTLTVPEDGLYWFRIHHTGIVRIYLDGELALETKNAASMDAGAEFADDLVRQFEAGRAYAVRVDYIRRPGQDVIYYRFGLGRTFKKGQDPRLARAVQAARRADVALVFAGYADGYESEGWDRPHMDLTGRQDELIAAVAAANPRTVVVLNAGSPITMPWVDQVAAIVEAYYPGLENGNAVAAVLLGEVNPSGKLPVTFPKRLQDSPAFINASYYGAREVNYGEGIFVGYRYFDKVELDPLFAFGHGLSYTMFEYSGLKLPRTERAGQPLEVTFTVRNTGKVAGKEVVQLYVSDSESSLPRPPKELKGFAKVDLKPGESKEVTFRLDQRSMAFYDPHKKQWVVEPGEFQVLVGSSSRDIRLKGKFTLK
jgi:beta-glucosidase